MIPENDYLRGISIEDDPFEGEIPDQTLFFDREGNEVNPDEAE